MDLPVSQGKLEKWADEDEDALSGAGLGQAICC